MILFDWTEQEHESVKNRFQNLNLPEGTEIDLNWWNNERYQLENDSELKYPSIQPDRSRYSRPRLFVSHRQHDKECARRVAWLANEAGFDVWLDILDLDDGKAPKVIAAIIEVALLNCTHVCVVMTEYTKGSFWVPYEYGRVKERLPQTKRALCYLSPDIENSDENLGYMVLGKRIKEEDESKLNNWLKDEFDDHVKEKKSKSDEDKQTIDVILKWPKPECLWKSCNMKDNSRV